MAVESVLVSAGALYKERGQRVELLLVDDASSDASSYFFLFFFRAAVGRDASCDVMRETWLWAHMSVTYHASVLPQDALVLPLATRRVLPQDALCCLFCADICVTSHTLVLPFFILPCIGLSAHCMVGHFYFFTSVLGLLYLCSGSLSWSSSL
jgi:hypothetical protein